MPGSVSIISSSVSFPSGVTSLGALTGRIPLRSSRVLSSLIFSTNSRTCFSTSRSYCSPVVAKQSKVVQLHDVIIHVHVHVGASKLTVLFQLLLHQLKLRGQLFGRHAASLGEWEGGRGGFGGGGFPWAACSVRCSCRGAGNYCVDQSFKTFEILQRNIQLCKLDIQREMRRKNNNTVVQLNCVVWKQWRESSA